jgi:hypothetical protein
MSLKKGPDPGSEILDPEKIHPGSGSRIQGVKSTGSRIRIRNTVTDIHGKIKNFTKCELKFDKPTNYFIQNTDNF